MRRLFPLLFLAALPAALAAPAPREARTEFGTNGLLTGADLEKVRFDSRAVPGAESAVRRLDAVEKVKRAGPDKVRAKNPYDVAVHMPQTRFRVGEPVPAYFVLRNNRPDPLDLAARLDLFGPDPITWNGCEIRVRDARTGKPVEGSRQSGYVCGDGRGLVDVPGDGYYCVRGDLGALVGAKALPAGEYEVDWRCGNMRSAPVRFSVLNVDGPNLPPRPARPNPYFLHIGHGLEDEDESGTRGAPIRWRECNLDPIRPEDMAAALAVGEGGAFVPDVHAIPAADKYVEAWAEWRPYRDGDRLVVTLRAVPPYEYVRFEEPPQLFLQLELPDGVRARPDFGDEKMAELLERATLITPLTIEAKLPDGWRERVGAGESARVAVLVASKEVELPGPLGDLKKRALREVTPDDAPVWRGTVRTDSVELRFPPQLPTRKP
jgi:hypothetical protein